MGRRGRFGCILEAESVPGTMGVNSGWLQTIGTCPLTRILWGPKSRMRCWQGRAPSAASNGGAFPPPPPPPAQVVAASLQCQPLWPHDVFPAGLCVFLAAFSSLTRSPVLNGFGVYPTSG